MSIYEKTTYGMQKAAAGAPTLVALKTLLSAMRTAKPAIQAGTTKSVGGLKSAVINRMNELASLKAAHKARMSSISGKLNPPNYAEGAKELADEATRVVPKLSPKAIEYSLLGGMGGTTAYLAGKKAINDHAQQMVDEHNLKIQNAVPEKEPAAVTETREKAEATRHARKTTALKNRQSQEKQQKEFNAANDAYTRALFGTGGVLAGGALGAAIAGEGNRLTGGLIGGGVGGGAGLLAHYLAKKYNLV